jgi:hypothetical protein
MPTNHTSTFLKLQNGGRAVDEITEKAIDEHLNRALAKLTHEQSSTAWPWSRAFENVTSHHRHHHGVLLKLKADERSLSYRLLPYSAEPSPTTRDSMTTRS